MEQKHKKNKLRGCLLIFCFSFIAFLAIAFFVLIKYGPEKNIYIFPPSPQQYAEMAIKQMNQFGMYTDSKAWITAKTEAQKELKSAKNYSDTYTTLGKLVKIAGGKHSFFQPPQQKSAPSGKSYRDMPKVTRENYNTLIIKLPPFDYNSDTLYRHRYAACVLKELNKKSNISGIIIDLRGNTGGDMWPMIAAVSPLLPDGELLNFDVRGKKSAVNLKKGLLSCSGSSMRTDGFKLPANVRIAILTDSLTGSSGEATLLTFRGLPYTKVFGSPTAGYASCNRVITLYDGAYFAITIGKDVARTGESFCNDPIQPDIKTLNPLKDALRWLSNEARISSK